METVTLTYAELAARLGVKDESARKTAQRRKWRKFKGNDGFTRVEVPLEDLPPPEPPPFIPGPTPDEIMAGLREANARLEAEMQSLARNADAHRSFDRRAQSHDRALAGRVGEMARAGGALAGRTATDVRGAPAKTRLVRLVLSPAQRQGQLTVRMDERILA